MTLLWALTLAGVTLSLLPATGCLTILRLWLELRRLLTRELVAGDSSDTVSRRFVDLVAGTMSAVLDRCRTRVPTDLCIVVMTLVPGVSCCVARAISMEALLLLAVMTICPVCLAVVLCSMLL